MFLELFSSQCLLRESQLASERIISSLFRDGFAHLNFSAVIKEEWAATTPVEPNSHRSDTTVWIKEKKNKVKTSHRYSQNNIHIFSQDSFYINTIKTYTNKIGLEVSLIQKAYKQE